VFNDVAKFEVMPCNKSIKVSPNTADSKAAEDPKYTSAPSNTIGPVVSKFIDSIAFKLIDLADDSKI
jgi:hypothetical protein